MPRALIAGAGPAALLAASLEPELRPLAAVVIALGWAALVILRRPEAIGWAAVLPVAVVLTWPWVLGGDVPVGEIACVEPASAIVVRRVAVAVVVLGLVAVLARIHASGAGELGLRRPSVPEAAMAIAGCLLLAVVGLWIGPAVARPFFGALDFAVQPAALVPAVAFGLANGTLEEVAYRGAMQAWLARLAPLWLAIGFQALVFGIVHAGPEVVALLPLHIALLTGVGLAGGLVRWRTGSLWIPIGVHVGADIALYVGLACRAAGT
jgi:membrane protease YdiL (CAAX protease family)